MDPTSTFKGADELGALGAATSCVVESAGETGCGFAQPWEALYHFLIDPAPYTKAAVNCTAGPAGDACGNNDIVVAGRDEDLLAQRAAFLRPDSLVVVVVLSDQNDVSLRPAGKNWLPFAYPEAKMQRGWEACEGLPDDLEPDSSGPLTALGCFSCFQDNKNPNCTKPWSASEDAVRLRGFHQVQRFGFNFLWSRERYVDAFKNATVPGSDGRLGPNALFSSGFRDPSLVLVTGIVGVPKHLVEESGKPKVLSTADWAKLTGPIGKRDPHLIESVGPRAGLPTFAGDRSVDPVHGGERFVPGVQQLQAACIKPRPSTPSIACAPLGSEAVDPLCEPGGKQAFTQAYPGLRHLRILEQLGPSGLVASICSETFAPTMTAIATHVRAILGARCLRTIPPAASADRASCSVEVLPDLPAGKTCETLTGVGGGTGYCTPGSAPCRKEGDFLGPSDKEMAARQLAIRLGAEIAQATVEGENVIVRGSDGTKHLVCELLQLSADRTDAATSTACRTDQGFSPPGGGYCYSSDPAMIGDVCLHQGAASTLRFVGDVQPKAGSEIFPVCGKC
ncbi:MAG: hypothetical protein IPJ34_02560 [Myxococcales bacterium]|nr:hypothetical protein [Myxococcales bacterium]